MSPAPSITVLVVADTDDDRTRLRTAVPADLPVHVEAVATADAESWLSARPVRVCVVDSAAAVPLLAVIRRRRPVRVAVVLASPSVEDVARVLRAGADDVWTKPVSPHLIRRAVEEAAREDAAAADGFHGIVSRNARMQDVFAVVRRVAPTSSTVLIEGETGTGKEQLARALHAAAADRAGAFVAVNCAAIPETLLEAELFGYEKGAFTGADRQRVGKFEQAHGGTLFLDEVGDIPPTMQVKLLRVLQGRTVERVGGADVIPVDVRVVAATNRPLRKLVRRGAFREDLYYRLNVIQVKLPPLRSRTDDIPPLADHFCRKYARPGGPVKRLSAAALDQLISYPWPGNVRELENVIERACVLHEADVIEADHLPPELRRPAGRAVGAVDLRRPLRDVLRDCTARLEKRYIIRALKKTRGHVGRAAKICGYCRRSLTAKIAEYKIDRLSLAAKG